MILYFLPTFKKSISCILLVLLFTTSAFGQTINGKIVDPNGSAIPFATIGLLNTNDSSLVTGTITDEKGIFMIQKTSAGSFLLKIAAFGFNNKFTDPIRIDTSSKIDLPPIILNSQGIDLNEVSVSAIKRTIEFKNGNIIVNVQDSPLAKGNTVYDLLSKLPGVSIDNGVILLNGKAGVIMMLDGRVQQLTNIQLLNMLKSMNAELVEKIELLKNPPAKYDASGTAGMINIKTKKTKLMGLSGTVYTSLSQGFCPRSMTGLALNYKSDKIALFSNLDYNYGYYQSLETFDKPFEVNSRITEFYSVNKVKDLDNSLNYKIGADWFVNKRNIVGFKVDGGPGSYTSDGKGTTSVLRYNDLGFDHLKATAYIPDNWKLNNYNVNAEHHFDSTGTVLNFTSDYTRLSETYSSDVQNLFFDINDSQVLPSNNYRNNNLNTTSIFASKLDFTKALDSSSSFEAGAKVGFVNTVNEYLFEREDNTTGKYYNDTSLTNNYSYSEQTYAAYFNYIKSFKKVNIQIGIRAENTNLIGRNTEKGFELKRSYYNIFPNISVAYTISKNNNFQLNVNRRIDRPQYSDLSPFRSYRDQYSYFEGNPFLQPHYSNTIDFTHSYKDLLTNTLTYTRIDKVMLFYTKQNDSSKVTEQTIKNMRYNNYYAYSFFIQRSIRSWWEIAANGVFSYIEYVGDVSGTPFKTASFYYAPSLTNTFTAPRNTKIEINAFYNSGKNVGLVQIKPRWMLSLAIKKTFFAEKLDCSIGINDLFNTGYFRTGVHFDNQNWDFKVNQDSRRVVISINYNFGRVKINERETSANEQEKGRLNH